MQGWPSASVRRQRGEFDSQRVSEGRPGSVSKGQVPVVLVGRMWGAEGGVSRVTWTPMSVRWSGVLRSGEGGHAVSTRTDSTGDLWSSGVSGDKRGAPQVAGVFGGAAAWGVAAVSP